MNEFVDIPYFLRLHNRAANTPKAVREDVTRIGSEADQQISSLKMEIAQLKREQKPQSCAAGKGDPPQDCDAPFCGCNPEWTKVMQWLDEAGWKSREEVRKLEADIASRQSWKESAIAKLRDMDRQYVLLMENGRDRIVFLGGDCDPLDMMERGSPVLIALRKFIAESVTQPLGGSES